MAFEKLKEGLQVAIKNLRKAVVLDKKIVREYLKEIQKAMLSADVDVKLVFQLSKNIEDRGLLEKPPGSLSRQENIIRITYEELVKLLGEGEKPEVKESSIILLVGTQGSGKTTTSAKLALYYKKQGMNPKLICADAFRPAAYDQLKQLSAEIDVSFYGEPAEKDTLKIIEHGIQHFKNQGLIVIDSEGRHKLNEDLMRDINRVHSKIKPDKTFLVLDGTIGQEAGAQAKAFGEACGIDGIILTKLDGSAKGGGAISACSATGAVVYFIGVGEHLADFEGFDSKRFVSRLLGFGDIEGLLEKAKEVEVDEESAKRFMSGEFNLNDVYEQIEQMSKLGPMKKVLEMLPLNVSIPQDMLQMQESKVKRFRFIMDSMTPDEKENPLLIKGARIDRIALGSGSKPEDVRELLNYYKRMKKMVKTMGSGRKLKQFMKRFGGGLGA